MFERLLVVLTGPVGGGKSAVALALATRLRASGHPTAVIDLDLVYCMARQRDGFADEETWRTARRGAAVLADEFFDSGAKVVVVEGGFFTQEECDGLCDHIASGRRLRLVTLNVSFERALHRAQSDPNMGSLPRRSRSCGLIAWFLMPTDLLLSNWPGQSLSQSWRMRVNE